MGRTITKSDPSIGTVFGLWKVTGPSQTINGERMLPVVCECGTAGLRLFANIVAKKSMSCGCIHRVNLPAVGDSVGEWTILAMDGPYHVTAKCSCGSVERRYIYTLGKDSMSCGHPIEPGYLSKYGKNGRARGNRGRERSKLKRIYGLMIERCTVPTSYGYNTYGGRGITVCEEWTNNEESFATWAIEAGYRVGQKLQLDRVDTNGPYSPENCRWVTATENVRNRRNTRTATAWGETKAVAAWTEDPRCMVIYGTLLNRLDRGMDPEKAISMPPHRATS